MPKYEVTLKEIEIYVITIEACDHDEAIRKAWDMLDSEESKQNYHHDSDCEDEFYELN